jgi:hypothetical protein
MNSKMSLLFIFLIVIVALNDWSMFEIFVYDQANPSSNADPILVFN